MDIIVVALYHSSRPVPSNHSEHGQAWPRVKCNTVQPLGGTVMFWSHSGKIDGCTTVLTGSRNGVIIDGAFHDLEPSQT
jgi:hypothetical protein